MILAIQILEFKILAFQNPDLKILAAFQVLAFQNLEFKILDDLKILAFQTPEFKILVELRHFDWPKSCAQDFG